MKKKKECKYYGNALEAMDIVPVLYEYSGMPCITGNQPAQLNYIVLN